MKRMDIIAQPAGGEQMGRHDADHTGALSMADVSSVAHLKHEQACMNLALLQTWFAGLHVPRRAGVT
jgi:hypothetical protein